MSAWIVEVQAERLAAEVELERSTGQRNQCMTRDRLAMLVNDLGNLLDVLAKAAPEDKAEVHRQLGLRLTYDPARRVVIARSRTRERESVWENRSDRNAHRPLRAPPWAKVSVGGGT